MIKPRQGPVAITAARERRQAADRARAEAKRKQARLERARREALRVLGCPDCGASKDQIRTEQARLRAEFYARQAARAAA